MKKNAGFFPEEIIFAVTEKCNLRCEHCFTKKQNQSLDSKEAVKFLKSCKEFTKIHTVGFSGGEPFLNLDFLEKVISEACKMDFMFGRIMTNGLWWKTEEELNLSLLKIYDAGFDGKIGLSVDSFHNNDIEKTVKFIKTSCRIFSQKDLIEIQSVINPKMPQMDLNMIQEISEKLCAKINSNLDKKSGRGIITVQNDDFFIKVYRQTQVLNSENPDAWKSKKWFYDDFCKGPGNIFYVHSDKKVAPCCGFANENSCLIIGNINDDAKTILQNAQKNSFVKICFEKGLSSLTKKVKDKKTDEICTFCDYVFKNQKIFFE